MNNFDSHLSLVFKYLSFNKGCRKINWIALNETLFETQNSGTLALTFNISLSNLYLIPGDKGYPGRKTRKPAKSLLRRRIRFSLSFPFLYHTKSVMAECGHIIEPEQQEELFLKVSFSSFSCATKETQYNKQNSLKRMFAYNVSIWYLLLLGLNCFVAWDKTSRLAELLSSLCNIRRK